jgi:hypothetical protein
MEVVITRRLFSFFLAGVVAASTIFPAFAWNRDSFISGGEEYEPEVVLADDLPLADVYAAPRRAPRMVKVSAADQAAAEANTTGKLVVPATLPTSVDGTFQVMSKYYNYQPAQSTPPLPKFEADYWRDIVATFAPAPYFSDDGYVFAFYSSLNYKPSIGSDEKVRGLAAFCNKDKAIFPKGNYVTGAIADVGSDSWSFTANYDVSSFSSSAFSLDGRDLWQLFANGPYWPSWSGQSTPLSVSVFVDGQQVLSLSRSSPGYFDFGGYVFSGSSNVSIISFTWTMPFLFFVSDDAKYAGNYEYILRSVILSSAANPLTISFLDGQDIINAQNDKTKSDINKHEEYESQWTGSMAENFNALGFDSFSWSDSLVSGFSLFSGIFMDIWRALGGATILFTFPLLLGVALLLIGRISRSGGRSGSGKGGGDGG